MGPGHHPAHIPGKIRPEAGIQPAAVGHGRVHEQQGIRPRQQVEKPADLLRLQRGGQITGADGVQGHVLAFPVAGDGQQLVRQVPADEAGEHGVGAEHRRGHNGTFHRHGGNHRQRHRQGAAPQAGDVLDTGNAFHKRSSVRTVPPQCSTSGGSGQEKPADAKASAAGYAGGYSIFSAAQR